MAALRTDFQDDIFDGSRKYRVVNNSDGTISLMDATQYVQVGDVYGAFEINQLNQIVNDKGIVVSNTNIPPANRVAGNMYFFYS